MNERIKTKTKNSTEGQLLVIFGANGDLSHRKLLPAIFHLFVDNLLPDKFAVIGAGSDGKTEETFRTEVRTQLAQFAPETVADNPDKLTKFLELLYYKPVNNKIKEDFDGLKSYINTLCTRLDIPRNLIYYFSIPPFMYEVVAAHLVSSGLNTEKDGWKRIIVEKPFGYSYDSAVELDGKLHDGFAEHQI